MRNSKHTKKIRGITQRFREDSRCLAMFLSGSLGRGLADQYSDVDMAIVVSDEVYDSIRVELPAFCEAELGELAVWLPEEENAEYSSYAFLCHQGGQLLLYDLAVIKHSSWDNLGIYPVKLLFDKTAALNLASEDGRQWFDPGRLPWLIRNFWVYMYLNGKYYRRSDIYKILYVQNVLFQTHVKLLHYLQPMERWHWWAHDVYSLSVEKQRQLLIYFGSIDLEGLATAAAREMSFFSKDASTACKKWGIEYPVALEQGVRAHLAEMGIE